MIDKIVFEQKKQEKSFLPKEATVVQKNVKIF
jgi:hypothetical protein